ncbi:MAG: deoxynucleoside kinase [Candidatus Kariarchaeaceae archaeon]|jgi:deoxyadenosine/deoxycytidine kinase
MDSYFKPIIWVEGNIGAGKTTLSHILEKELGYRGFYEPVDSNPYLQDFYEDPKRWAFPMQIEMLHRRYAMQQLAAFECTTYSQFHGAIIDRGLPGDRVFAKIHTDEGNISQREWETYEKCYNIMTRSLTPPSLMIYLDVDPKECYYRARSRARDQEAGVEDQKFYDYLFKLEKYYNKLLDQIDEGDHSWSAGIKVLKVDWNKPITSNSIGFLIDRICSEIKVKRRKPMVNLTEENINAPILPQEELEITSTGTQIVENI